MRNEAYRIDTFRRRWIVFCNDLWLLTELYLAHFIVWRELRRMQREGEIR